MDACKLYSRLRVATTACAAQSSVVGVDVGPSGT